MDHVQYSKECSGCNACADICPKSAIIMKPDSETFLYPEVDEVKCINCGICRNVCPTDFDNFIDFNEIESYIGVNKNKDILYNSSSGGAFLAICSVYISKGYVIYGAYFTDDLRLIHRSAQTIDECLRFCKSKYLSSNMSNIYTDISSRLINGQSVLFSGTPCQCAALQLFLNFKKINNEKIVYVNILCHGVPSQAIFDCYINEQGGVVNYQFRHKSKEKSCQLDSRNALFYSLKDRKYSVRSTDNDPYLRGFYKRLFYRPSCYSCKFARRERCADITIGDAWGLERFAHGINPKEGVSLILFNTEKAKNIIEDIKRQMNLFRVNIDDTLKSQSIFIRSIDPHPNREKFFKLQPKIGFEKSVMISTRPTMSGIIKSLKKTGIKMTIKKVIKRITK